MSVRAMARVWDVSTHSGTELLMLLAIADFADDSGNAYPSVPTLAEKCRMSGRNANFILSALRSSGELEVRANEGPRGTNRYRIVLPGLEEVKRHSPAKGSKPLKSTSPVTPEAGFTPEDHFTLKPTSSPPEAGFPKPLKPASDEPSLNHHEPPVVTAHATRTASTGVDRGSRLPADWSLPADFRAYCVAKRPDLNPEDVAEDFRDYWVAKPGSQGLKSDWLATWRTWVRKQRAPFASAGQRSTAATSLQADNTRPAWALTAGFANRFEAESSGCNERNAAQFRDGRRITHTRERA